MKLRKLHGFLATVVLLLFSFSCASDLDLDQVNDLKLEPVVVANLANFDVNANEFAAGAGEFCFGDASTIEIFNGSFFRDNLKKAELSFEIENTINRAFEIDLLFLDNKDQFVHAVNLNVSAFSGLENKMIKKEIFENTQLDLLKKTTKIVFSLTMLEGSPLTSTSGGTLKFRSGATAYIIVE